MINANFLNWSKCPAEMTFCDFCGKQMTDGQQRMTAWMIIQWKRKIARLDNNKSNALIFPSTSRIDEESAEEDEESKSKVKKRSKPDVRRCPLEDSGAKSRRLKSEGIFLAENGRYWESLNKWKESLSLSPDDETIYEMMSQVEQSLSEYFPAITSAEKAISLKPMWATAHQTLARGRMNIGEVDMAMQSFCRAARLNPELEEIWDDIEWVKSIKSTNHCQPGQSFSYFFCSTTVVEINESMDERFAIFDSLCKYKDFNVSYKVPFQAAEEKLRAYQRIVGGTKIFRARVHFAVEIIG
uniref:Uncharacterized protein n=1 Tax=Romanomermis culicivorax TaxID=13658 RepID=A0A915KWS7_ROMCU